MQIFPACVTTYRASLHMGYVAVAQIRTNVLNYPCFPILYSVLVKGEDWKV